MLLKGVNKRVIVIKNPESEIFEEAYFIIRSSNIINGLYFSKNLLKVIFLSPIRISGALLLLLSVFISSHSHRIINDILLRNLIFL